MSSDENGILLGDLSDTKNKDTKIQVDQDESLENEKDTDVEVNLVR